MKRFKHLLAFSAVALLTLSGCGNSYPSKDPYAGLELESDVNIIDELAIV